MKRIHCLVALVLVAHAATADADVLFLSAAIAGTDASDADMVRCFYTADGTLATKPPGTVTLYVSHPKSFLDRVLGRALSATQLREACPQTVINYPSPVVQLPHVDVAELVQQANITMNAKEWNLEKDETRIQCTYMHTRASTGERILTYRTYPKPINVCSKYIQITQD